MLDLSPIASAVKTVAPPPPQAMPDVAEETKSAPGTETPQAVAASASAKGSEPGLGEHVDVYDTQAHPDPAPSAPAKSAKKKQEEAEKAAQESLELLGKDSEAFPQPTTNPPPQELPFLKPLGPLGLLGQTLDAKG